MQSRDIFLIYEVVNINTVKMVNNIVNKVVGRGTIRFCMHYVRILKLKGIQHVPSLRENLVFLGMPKVAGFHLLMEFLRFSRKTRL